MSAPGLRVLRAGAGDPRTAVVVYHVGAASDAAYLASLPEDVLLANDTGPSGVGYYGAVPPLERTLAELRARTGSGALGPVVVAGFSEGGFATLTVLRTSSVLPDALVLADATYGSDVAPWRAWVDSGRVLVASYSSNTFMEPARPSPWRNLERVTGLDLPLGADASPRPDGVRVIAAPETLSRPPNVLVRAYPDLNHGVQGAVVLPRALLPQALASVGASLAPAGGPRWWWLGIPVGAAAAWWGLKVGIKKMGRTR